MTRKERRLALVLGGLGLLGAAVALILAALNQNIVYFYAPADLAAHPAAEGRRIRLGGLVMEGSIKREADNFVDFAVTDRKAEVKVRYQGVLPDLFAEGRGVVAEGHMGSGGRFVADEILAKHDERYMPREVADALKRAGEWRPQDAP
jgi:cytochrome c-type biogenesis protein CcmE